MAYKPILFNTEMVKAILEGRKTQTRRIIRPQPVWDGISCFHISKYGCWEYGRNDRIFSAEDNWPINTGDILWVRETWHKDAGRYMYRANYSKDEKFYRNGQEVEIRWSPSIHMPKQAARIFLRVKDVRVERLQKCGDGWCVDIENEGVKTPQNPILYVNDDKFHDALRAEMEKLWDSTIKPADLGKYGWDANPWVWVIEFERCEKPEGWC